MDGICIGQGDLIIFFNKPDSQVDFSQFFYLAIRFIIIFRV